MAEDQTKTLIEIMQQHSELIQQLTKSLDEIAESIREQTAANKRLYGLVMDLVEKIK